MLAEIMTRIDCIADAFENMKELSPPQVKGKEMKKSTSDGGCM